MIDELVKAANAIEKAGIKSQDWHPKLKVLPKASKKKPCVRVWLTVDGHIHDIEPLPQELVAELRKYEPDNGKSLPGFNVRPLYRLVKTKDEIKKASKGNSGENLKLKWTKEFLNRDIIEKMKTDFWEKTREGLRQSLGRIREELENTCNDSLVDGETLQKFFSIVAQIDVVQFQNEYEEKLKGKIRGISHLGWQDEFDVLTAISAIGVGLSEMGHTFDTEKALKTARNILFSK